VYTYVLILSFTVFHFYGDQIESDECCLNVFFVFYFFACSMSITVAFHHGGLFVRDWLICYKGGEESVVDIDVDKWCYFELEGYADDLHKKYKYGKRYRLWWKVEEEVDFKIVRLDEDAEVMKEYAGKKKCKLDIFIEHDVVEGDSGLVNLPKYIEESEPVKNRSCKGKEKVVESEGFEDEEVDAGGYSSDEDGDVRGDKFDDSEEDRALGLEDGFGLADSNNLMIEGPSTTHPDTRNENEELLDGVEIDVDYESDSLGSSDPDNSDEEKGPRYEKFRMEQRNKTFKFKVGMEFKSLAEFKEALTEWTVINGWEFKMVKNDKQRIRAVCNNKLQKCNFVALCSQVGDQHTYRIKTWTGDHTCGRTTYNRSANSKWVTKVQLPKIMCTEKVKVLDIMKDMRRNQGVGVTFYRAWRAKKRAKDIIEGEAAKQYTLLWRYAAELMRVSKGNSIKINTERPAPTIQPRFGSFYFCFEGLKQGFLSGCRPFIGIDGCHLKTQYGGQLLIAVGRDANDQYYPLAFGVVEVENKESWRWFLTLLLEDIGTDKRWVFISINKRYRSEYYCFFMVSDFFLFLISNLLFCVHVFVCSRG